jgi:hypothetical protein
MRVFLSFVVVAATCQAWSPMSSRRNWFSQTANNAVVVIAGALSVPPDACANDELPSIIRGYTVLAPLGKPETTSQKTTGLSLVDLASRLTRDLTDGATGQGGYFLSGDLSTDIFQDDCEFVDPTNRVSSLSRYQKALRILFDPSQSIVQLVAPLTINEDELHEGNPTTMASPKRFQADIQRGELCVQRIYCAPLPIEGQGLFDSVYVGERLRIGQNINGGRARVVQIRLDEGVVV